MDTEGLIQLAKKYQQNKEFITNEETAKMALIVPFLELLGYNTNNPREVRLEFSAPFTQGDGKRLPDRMDYALFDESGERPLFVIEAKPLGLKLKSRTQQLARYISQLEGLHFGIITDGCNYLFFGDLENPNVMDSEPFFTFALDDGKEDWERVTQFLRKFSREAFNAKTLVIDAENNRYRHQMILKLTQALKNPQSDESFLRWITDDIYGGKRTSNVMERLTPLVKETIEPALLKVLGSSIADSIRAKFGEMGEVDEDETQIEEEKAEEAKPSREITTTDEELQFYHFVQAACTVDAEAAMNVETSMGQDLSRDLGVDADAIIYNDRLAYFNVSYLKPRKWFLRYFGSSQKKSIVTLIPLEELRSLAQGFEVDEPGKGHGPSRVYIDDISQLKDLREVVIRSFEILRGIKVLAPGVGES